MPVSVFLPADALPSETRHLKLGGIQVSVAFIFKYGLDDAQYGFDNAGWYYDASIVVE